MALSFAQDIRPLFREKDIECMRDYEFDLSNLRDVRMNAAHIYERLHDKSMPQDGPWSDEDVAKFKRWIGRRNVRVIIRSENQAGACGQARTPR